MIRSLLLAAAVVAGVAPALRTLRAQQVDVVRGRVVTTDSMPLRDVLVTVTSASGAGARTARTDARGSYAVAFPDGDARYVVTFVALGFAPERVETRRRDEDAVLIANAVLRRAAQPLAPLQVQARAGGRARGDDTDIGGSDRWADAGFLAPHDLGDLAATAATIPGVLLVPDESGGPAGFSVLGLAADQNVTTLNGARFPGFQLPRDAVVATTLATAPFDVSRGGFSGAQLSLRTRSGTNFPVRRSSVNLDSPRLQWLRSGGVQSTSAASLGGIAAGPVVPDRAFYSVAWQLGRRASALHTLLDESPAELRTAGIAADSVTALLGALSRIGVPATVSRVPSARDIDQGSVLAAFDFRPASRSSQSIGVVVTGARSMQNPAALAVTELPAHAGERTVSSGSVQVAHSALLPAGLLTETVLAVDTWHSDGSPFVDLPSATVQIASKLGGGTTVRPVAFGGSPAASTRLATGDVALSNALSWFSDDARHHVKLAAELRRDGFAQDQSANRLGTFTYASLADLRAGRPASFTRALSSHAVGGDHLNAGVALGDAFRATDRLRLQYGVRLDADRFLFAPVRNDAVSRAFGVPNDGAPRHADVSPRVGFSWYYAGDAGGLGVARRRPVLQGGVGAFQGTPVATLLAAPALSTGLASGAQQLTCIGAAAPTPDWSAYWRDAGQIPASCAGGAAAKTLTSGTPNVVLMDPSFASPRSVRSMLQWQAPVLDRYVAQIEGTYSVNRNQPGTTDLDFSPIARFTLGGEGGRPVYVQSSDIVTATGAMSTRDSRASGAFGHVTAWRSDLGSTSRQVIARVAPAAGRGRWSFAYVWSDVQESTHGFLSTAGNPLDMEWSPATLGARHQILYSISREPLGLARLSWYGTFRSGLPFTPMVAGDINGDGYANDRAYVFDPAHTADAPLASAMRSLLARGAGGARRCLAAQLGRVAARNACEGPWRSSATMTIAPVNSRWHLPPRADVSFAVGNPLGAADLLLHGNGRLHGWGQNGSPDPWLLYVRGFDAVNRRFRYDVNQHFGESNARVLTAPVALTATLRIDLGGVGGARRVGRVARGGALDPIADLLASADSLELTRMQVDTLSALERWYATMTDAIWAPARALESAGAASDSTARVQRAAAAREARDRTLALLGQTVPVVRSLLTEEQLRVLPIRVARLLDPAYLAQLRGSPPASSGR